MLELGAAQLDPPPPVVVLDKCNLDVLNVTNLPNTDTRKTELIHSKLSLVDLFGLISASGVSLRDP